MLDHIGLVVSDFKRAQAFYDAALAPLGIGVVMQVSAQETGSDPYVGYGSGGKPYFWMGSGGQSDYGHHGSLNEIRVYRRDNCPDRQRTISLRCRPERCEDQSLRFQLQGS